MTKFQQPEQGRTTAQEDSQYAQQSGSNAPSYQQYSGDHAQQHVPYTSGNDNDPPVYGNGMPPLFGDGMPTTTTGGETPVSMSRVKERDSVKMPPYPTDANFQIYKSECAQASITGSGRPSEALTWHSEIDILNLEELEAVQPLWQSWDCKCLEALKATIKGPERSDLLRRINMKISEKYQVGQLFSYRAALRMLFDEFSRDPQRAFNRLLRDLEALVITDYKEPGLRQFHARYAEIAGQMRTSFKPENEVMVTALLLNKLDDQLSRVTVLKDPFMSFLHRNKLDPLVYNAAWIEKQLTLYLDNVRLEKTEQRLEQQRKDINAINKVHTAPATTDGNDTKTKKQGSNKAVTEKPKVKAPPTTIEPPSGKAPSKTDVATWLGQPETYQMMMAVFKGKGKGKKPKGNPATEDEKTKTPTAGNTPVVTPRAQAAKDAKGKGKGKRGDCHYWIKYGNCNRGSNCTFEHAPCLEKSQPDAAFPVQSTSAAIAATHGSSWIDAMLAGQHSEDDTTTTTTNTGHEWKSIFTLVSHVRKNHSNGVQRTYKPNTPCNVKSVTLRNQFSPLVKRT